MMGWYCTPFSLLLANDCAQFLLWSNVTCTLKLIVGLTVLSHYRPWLTLYKYLETLVNEVDVVHKHCPVISILDEDVETKCENTNVNKCIEACFRWNKK